MKISKNIIKAMAIEDMHSWILKFVSGRSLAREYDEETQELYSSYIKKLQERIIKEL